MYVTVYTTRYNTQYAIITRYWGVLPDGTYVLKSSETRYLTPEEYVEEMSEEEKRRKAGRAQAPRGEETTTAVGVLT
jgi:archaellum component FlaF (FlaF/FlaG flagellin family)